MNTFKKAFLLSVLAIFIFFLQEKSGIAEARALTRGKVRIAKNVVSGISKNGIKHMKHAKRKIVSSSAKKKHGIPGERRSFSSKHFIERSLQPNNPFGHLSDLLGIKGSFIPSQTNQNWLGDDEQSASDNDMETNSEKTPESHNVNNDMSSIGGTLPLDISPQQANMIASSAPTNQQRQKFLKWEHQSGSLDMQHFPSKYLQDEKESDAADGEVNEAVERAPFHSRKPASVGADDVNGPAFSRMKADTNSPRFESVRPKKIIHALESSNNRNAAKKGYMEYMNDQFDTPAYPHSGNQLHQVNGYAGNRMSSSKVQPLTHEMINNLQMDPAWDAMEAKILAQHGHRGAPLRLAESKIDKEIMPPEGEPVGQPYLPEPQQRLHNTMINNFNRPAEFPPQDIQPEMKPASFYSHYQAQNGPHNIHMGGVLVHAVDDPWKTLKQTSYDQADDNFPVASSNSLMQSSTANANESPSEGKAVQSSPAGNQLFKGKGSKMRETSKFINNKNADNNSKLSGAKPKNDADDGKINNMMKQPKIQANLNKAVKVKNENEENEELELIKEIANKQKSQESANVNIKEKNNSEEIQEDTGPSKLIEDPNGYSQKVESNNGKADLKISNNNMNNNIRKIPIQREKNFEGMQEKQSNPPKGRKMKFRNQQTQMNEGQQGFMESGKNEEMPATNRITAAKSGQYITGKFVNFLKDVANHLNVDKLSIAEQLVKDVENSNKPKRNPNKVVDTREANAVENENEGLSRKLQSRELVALGNEYQERKKQTVRQKISDPMNILQIGRKKPEVIRYIWKKGISVLKEE